MNARWSLLLFWFLALAGCGDRAADPPMPAPSTPTSSGQSQPEAPVEPVFTELNLTSLRNRTLVVMYHDVIERRTRSSLFYDVTPDEFREQMQSIVDGGGTVISLDQLYDHLTKGTALPERPVVITFDDNYQGVADLAIPILDEFGFPSAVFAHTNFVGEKKKGRPKMSWDTLKELIEKHRVTVGSHTASHPNDMTLLTPDQQQDELVKSRDAIQKHLGFQPRYLAYANGKFDAITLGATREAGYFMAMAMDSGYAEASQSILAVRRIAFGTLKRHWDQREKELEIGFTVAETPIKADEIKLEEKKEAGTRFLAVTGGMPSSVLALGRQGVKEFVKQSDAVAGINGGFFAMAAINSDDNQMIGPCKASNRPAMIPSAENVNEEKLRNRPLVAWNEKELKIFPYVAQSMNKEAMLTEAIPDMTDCFLAGAWLVIDGKPLKRAEILAHGSKDAMDFRRRVFMGVREDGVMVYGASLGSVTAENVAAAAVDFQCKWAVMMDCGFSTSLVIKDRVLATGHSTSKIPSRPVPHAIVVKGTLSPTVKLPAANDTAEDATRPRRRRRHR